MEIKETKLYTVTQAAELMDCTPYTVREYVKARLLSARQTRPGARMKIPGAALLRFLDAGHFAQVA